MAPQIKPTRSPLKNWLITASFMLLGTIVSALLLIADPTGGFVSMIFVLMVVLVARLTDGYVYGVTASFIGVICVNFVFTYPYLAFNFTMTGYPVTFLTMLSVSLIVSTLTSQIKQQEQLRMETERETMRANLLRAVSHDLRTPLTSIAGSTSAILENDELISDEQRKKLLNNIRDEAQWLIRMVENLLSITRIGDTPQQLSKELEAAEEILSSVSTKFTKRFPNIQLHLSAPEKPLFVPMDAILIEQVLFNLLENAAYHSSCSQIQLFVRAVGNSACFTVQDNGTGIPPEMLPHLFSPSHSSRTQTTDQRRNMGSVCPSVLPSLRHTAALYLPPMLHRAVLFSDSLCRWNPQHRRIFLMKIKDKILIIEDEPNISNFMATILAANNYDTMTAYTGSEAISMITSHCPDLILLDLGLPDMDGNNILKFVREWSTCPILVVSARTHERDKVDALDAGADDYIVKPFGTSELLARIRTAIRHTRTHLPNGDIAQSGQFRALGMIIDYDKHLVTVDGEKIHLTQNEYKLVSLLGKYAGRVLTYDFLIKQLWGPKAKTDNQILRVNMANIRRKLEKNPAEPIYIFTEIGVGYRMVDPD